MADFDRLPRLGASFDPPMFGGQGPSRHRRTSPARSIAEMPMRRSDSTFNRGKLSTLLYTRSKSSSMKLIQNKPKTI